jgi:hypothetical protein
MERKKNRVKIQKTLDFGYLPEIVEVQVQEAYLSVFGLIPGLCDNAGEFISCDVTCHVT